MMNTMTNMQHEQGKTLSLKTGDTKELTWSFTNTAVLEASYSIPGYYDSGMKLKITVTKG
ncbi:hypothetical protein [Amphritea sp.]|uniref:hypothetical protein n=1 Tax=Amphritea sp. TaxID=1872502 RepID=UPI0025BA0024|nr:hypothetical protein [Amphritea sp.]